MECFFEDLFKLSPRAFRTFKNHVRLLQQGTGLSRDKCIEVLIECKRERDAKKIYPVRRSS